VGVLLDLNMPNVNGLQVLEYFKTNNLFEKIPVSIITGVGSDDLVYKTYDYPIIDVLRKPFNENDIKKVVNNTVNSFSNLQ
jgi:FixJ family two-component response regulator